MELLIARQGLQALASLACGPALGFFYDVLAEIRKRFGLDRVIWLFDALFCITAACVLFLLGVVVGQGKFRLFMPAVAIVGAALYFAALRRGGRAVASLAAAAAAAVVSAVVFPFKILASGAKKFEKISKNVFHYWRLWFKIKGKIFTPDKTKQNTGGKPDEGQAGKYTYQTDNIGFGGLRRSVPDKDAGAHRAGRAVKRRSRRAGARH